MAYTQDEENERTRRDIERQRREHELNAQTARKVTASQLGRRASGCAVLIAAAGLVSSGAAYAVVKLLA
jgi:hypothetical protein